MPGLTGSKSVDVSDILAKAWASVEAAGLPEGLQETAFKEAVRLLSSDDPAPARDDGGSARTPRPATKQTRRTSRGGSAKRAETTDTAHIDEDEFFDKIERETGVPRSALEQVLYLDGGNPRINLPARRLGANMKVRQQTVAQVLPVARHYGLDENETSTRVVREECARLKCLDEKNINLYLSNLDGIIYTGPRDAKVLRVRPAGVEVFERRLNELTGSGAGAED
jgi:hypothetical protein